MAEWPNVPDSKSGVPQGTVGSNPTLSASGKKPDKSELNQQLTIIRFFSFTTPIYHIGSHFRTDQIHPKTQGLILVAAPPH
jgi:hypothetical protein